jgi:hypothetical protein
VRTTIAIDDDVLAAARDLAKAERMTIGSVISDLARQGLRGNPQAPPPVTPQDEVDEWLLNQGIAPLPHRGVIVTNADVDRIRDELAV